MGLNEEDKDEDVELEVDQDVEVKTDEDIRCRNEKGKRDWRWREMLGRNVVSDCDWGMRKEESPRKQEKM